MFQLPLLFVSMSQGFNILNIVLAVILIMIEVFVVVKFKKKWQVNAGIIVILIGVVSLMFNVVLVAI